ncbi:MAG: hypothetical protein WKF65_18065 [Gaiellaceae bacterium]
MFELRVDVGELLERRGCEMLAVERIQVGIPRLLRPHQTLLGKTTKGSVDRRLRPNPYEA